MPNAIEPETKIVSIGSIFDYEIGEPMDVGTIVQLGIDGIQPSAEVCMTRSKEACPECIRTVWCGARFGKER